MLVSANCLASPINNVQMVKDAKVASVSMVALITKIALDNMSVFKRDVLILALLEKLVDQTVFVKLKTRLNIALAHLVLLECLLPFKAVSGSLINALEHYAPRITNA